eukprot:315570-Amphidinium_carterae.1
MSSSQQLAWPKKWSVIGTFLVQALEAGIDSLCHCTPQCTQTRPSFSSFSNGPFGAFGLKGRTLGVCACSLLIGTQESYHHHRPKGSPELFCQDKRFPRTKKKKERKSLPKTPTKSFGAVAVVQLFVPCRGPDYPS